MLLLSKPDDQQVEMLLEMWRHQLWNITQEVRQVESLRPKLSLQSMREAETKLLMAIVDLETAIIELDKLKSGEPQ